MQFVVYSYSLLFIGWSLGELCFPKPLVCLVGSGCMPAVFVLNPFTAPTCKNSWAERCTNVPANSVFSGPPAHLLSMLCVLMKVLLVCQCENEDKKA